MRFEKESFGALHQMLAGLDPAGREAVWAEIEEESPRGASFSDLPGVVFRFPSKAIVVAGR